MKELKPCPFCGSEHSEISLLVFSIFYDGSYSVYKDDNFLSEDEYVRAVCSECCAEGPSGNTGIEAIKRWNRHASPWIRVEYKLPKNKEWVLICKKYVTDKSQPGNIFHAMMWDKEKFCHDASGCSNKVLYVDIKDVTHWMPIPPIGGENE